MTYRAVITGQALESLRGISDARERTLMAQAVDSLSTDPLARGKPLLGELAGYRALRAVGQRYRIIYRVEEETVVVLVVALSRRREGDRGDVYALARRLLRLRLLDGD
jgi:mRNA interferase RelE/StbE